jgi:hypothetical protein
MLAIEVVLFFVFFPDKVPVITDIFSSCTSIPDDYVVGAIERGSVSTSNCTKCPSEFTRAISAESEDDAGAELKCSHESVVRI